MLGQKQGGGNKNALHAKVLGGLSENLLGNSKSSLAVFYVEQVALNRHVKCGLSAKTAATATALFYAGERSGCQGPSTAR